MSVNIYDPSTDQLKPISGTNSHLEDEMVAEYESTSTATHDYEVGGQFIYNGKLYEATSAISIGGTIITEGANANCIESDSLTVQIAKKGSGGHTILNESGTELPQRSKLQFEGAIVSDDSVNDVTVVETVNPVEYEEDIQSIQHQLTDQTNVLGAKNLIPYPYFHKTMTMNGLTCTDNGDGTITVNGKATAEVDFRLQTIDSKLLKLTPGEKYVLSAVPSVVGSEQGNRFVIYLQYILNRKFKYIGAAEKGGLTFVMPEYDAGTYQGLFIRIYEGKEFVNSTIIKPMLRLASDPDNTYVPYAMTNRELTEKKINLSDLKTIVSSSNDFAAFKTAIANL